MLLVLSMRTNIFLRTSRQLLQDLTNTKKPNPLTSNLLFDAPEENLEQMFGVKLKISEVMEPVLCKVRSASYSSHFCPIGSIAKPLW